jgi:N-acetylmuramoyl-L-alanine amidase
VRQITRIAVHHTASPPTTTAAEVDGWHRARGWSGIGYHRLVRLDAAAGRWVVEEGRPEARAGAHVAGANTDSLGVAVAGDWSAEAPPAEAVALVVEVCASWCRRYGIAPAAIRGHREHAGAATACPGRIPVDAVRAAVAGRLRGPTLAEARAAGRS